MVHTWSYMYAYILRIHTYTYVYIHTYTPLTFLFMTLAKIPAEPRWRKKNSAPIDSAVDNWKACLPRIKSRVSRVSWGHPTPLTGHAHTWSNGNTSPTTMFGGSSLSEPSKHPFHYHQFQFPRSRWLAPWTIMPVYRQVGSNDMNKNDFKIVEGHPCPSPHNRLCQQPGGSMEGLGLWPLLPPPSQQTLSATGG